MANFNHEVSVLVVDDEKNVRKSIELVLSNQGLKVLSAHEPGQALRLLEEHTVDVILLDIELGEIDGLTLFQKLRKVGHDQPVIFISGHASLAEAAQAVKIGGFDFIEKPFNSEKLWNTVQHCLELQTAKCKLAAIEAGSATQEMVGDSGAIQQVKAQAIQVANSSANVLIHGESGTGKELLAKMIHTHSPRANGPFITVNCSAIPESLIESELFGHEKGAFTGAHTNKRGYFELANRGTIFLDEIADLSLNAQAKVLRILENGELQKVGSETCKNVDVRVISASHKNLHQLAKEGKFRQDLLFRLNVVPLNIPALRERADDIPLLIYFFLEQQIRSHGLRKKTISNEAINACKQYSWPGNIRELKNLIERLLIMGPDHIDVDSLPEEIQSTSLDADSIQTGTLKDLRDKAERQFIISSLKRHGGNITQAAKELALGRSYLHRRMSQLQIEKKDYFC